LEPGGKRPLGRLVPHGLKQATCDADRLARWWARVPEANVGLATGAAFDVLDLDGPYAKEALRHLARANAVGAGRGLAGPTVATPRGVHLYVAATGRGNTTRLGGVAGVDWRGRGGYVVAPGSIRADGTRWAWRFPEHPRFGPDSPIVAPPPWLVDLFARRRPDPRRPLLDRGRSLASPAQGDRYWQAALERASDRMATSPEGSRNDTLNREAHSLARLVGGGIGDLGQAADVLRGAASRAGLGDMEVSATLRSAFRAGLANPRHVGTPLQSASMITNPPMSGRCRTPPGVPRLAPRLRRAVGG
jgi:hypothetical protein